MRIPVQIYGQEAFDSSGNRNSDRIPLLVTNRKERYRCLIAILEKWAD